MCISCFAAYLNPFHPVGEIRFSITKLLSIGLEKLGHPQPESNLSVEMNKGSPVVIST